MDCNKLFFLIMLQWPMAVTAYQSQGISQLESFLLDEMKTFRTQLADLQRDFTQLKSSCTDSEIELNKLITITANLNNSVQNLEARNTALEQRLVNSTQRLRTEMLTLEKSTNNSVFYIQLEQLRFQETINDHIMNFSSEVQYFNQKAEGLEVQITNINQSENYNHNISEFIGTVETQIQNLQSSVHNMDKVNKVLASNMSDISQNFFLSQYEKDVFFVYGASSELSFHGVRFNSSLLNTGIGYNSTTGRYTATKAGVYIIRATDIVHNSEHDVTPLVVNNIRQSGCFSDQKPGTMLNCQLILFLREGDQVWVQDFIQGPFHSPTTQFSGWRL